jgi:predicted nucleic acid-binding protein
VILDASFLVDLVADDDGATAKLREIDDERLIVPTLAYTEVGVGIGANTPQARRFEAVMDAVSMVPYDGESARRAVDLQRQLYDRGEPIGAIDAMIAGIALARDEAIVTRNVSEFSKTPARVSPY